MATSAASAYVVPAAGANEEPAKSEASSSVPSQADETIVQFHAATSSVDRRPSIGMGKPPALCTLSWSNVSYTVAKGSAVTTAEKAKTILKNATGRCDSGELTAIMGPSGSGKTTLLDILADRISTGRVAGSIELNGATREPRAFHSVGRYVAQEDSLLGCFTVKETLRMAARLTLSRQTTSRQVAEARVDRVLQEMGLQVCENTCIGDVFRKGISGGQKRRLSIAIELLSNPSVLLLDEPTSGLDSSATYNLMKLLTRLCQQGRTVVCTIHQPSSLVYDMFTNVAILAKGETVYFGPRTAMIPHFAAAGHPCPPYSNPTEFCISLVNADFKGHGDIVQLLSDYAGSTIARDVHQAIELDRGRQRASKARPSGGSDADAVSPWQQLRLLLYRNSLKNVRNPGFYGVRMVMYVVLALCVGTMYLQSNARLTDTDLVVLLFGIHAFFVFNSVAVVPFFIQERAVFLRERGNSGLHVGSFVIANFIAGLPCIFAISLASSVIVVALSGLKCFGLYLLNMFLSLVVAESLMHVLGAVANDGIIGIATGASVLGMFTVCEGFMVPRESIPGYWIWVHYMGFNTYAFEAFVHTQFLANPTGPLPLAVARLGFHDVSVGRNMAILAGYALGLECVFAAILYKIHTGRR